jgi:hypothetical protein
MVDNRKRTLRLELLLASSMLVAGIALSGLSLARIAAAPPQQFAQATPPLQGTPAPADSSRPAPAHSMPGGDRPTTPAPEPARPDAKAQQEGAQPALPPAPAEKTAPPIKEK